MDYEKLNQKTALWQKVKKDSGAYQQEEFDQSKVVRLKDQCLMTLWTGLSLSIQSASADFGPFPPHVLSQVR
jgi:hypothetical protein